MWLYAGAPVLIGVFVHCHMIMADLAFKNVIRRVKIIKMSETNGHVIIKASLL